MNRYIVSSSLLFLSFITYWLTSSSAAMFAIGCCFISLVHFYIVDDFIYIARRLSGKESEVVLCAANWYPELTFPASMENLKPIYWLPQNIDKGVVFSGRHHLQCMYQCYQTFGVTQKDVLEYQGFLTSYNRWVTRNEAGLIAYKAGQIKKPKYLFSEDLWEHNYPKFTYRGVPKEDERF